MKQIISLIAFSFLLTACSTEETKTIEYYSAHLDEAKTVKIECEKKTATLSENCKNAIKAVLDDSYKKSMFGDGITYE